MDRGAAGSGRTDVQTTGYGVSMPALHIKWANEIKIVFGCAFVACTLLSSCLSQEAPDLGDKAVGFGIQSLEGDQIVYEPISGNVHILYFWADWCPRCEDDFRLMEKLYQQWTKQPNSPVLIAVDVGQTEEHVRNFIKRMNISFPIYMDHEGKLARRFKVKGLPTYFVIDGKGVIRHIILGWADEKTLLAEIDKIR
ncbi:MAG: cytochrome c biosis protein CcmG, thiol:disulfide interchange protein DsbE [Thermodesulfobacteriota bacterium]|nr:cytochrome c biosis protein CcmG, thiol:disulfide interchange protein DsbE [Thermodesulfobacteriota bacterium]